jgi:excisionase family DNA binding protein|tara:strand:+ start:336 stop:626 length:291 start_codon:yes stop_codon:yes gene_type:complete
MELTKKQIMNLEVVHELTPLEELEAQIDKSVAIIKKQNAIINRTDSKLYNFSNAAKLLGVNRLTVSKAISKKEINTTDFGGRKWIPQSEIDRINLK